MVINGIILVIEKWDFVWCCVQLSGGAGAGAGAGAGEVSPLAPGCGAVRDALPSLAGFFIRPFYKMMLGKPITLKDMESVVRARAPGAALRRSPPQSARETARSPRSQICDFWRSCLEIFSDSNIFFVLSFFPWGSFKLWT